LFRSQDIATRRRWVKVVDDVKAEGGEVRVLSSMHESGKRLEGLGGIAAILTYPIEDLDEGLEDDEGAEAEAEAGETAAAHGIEGRRGHDEEIDF
jgi:protein pelota